MHVDTIWLTVRADMTVASLKDMVSERARGKPGGGRFSFAPRLSTLVSLCPFPLSVSWGPLRSSWTTASRPPCSSG